MNASNALSLIDDDPRTDEDELEMAVVRHQTAYQWRGFFRHDPSGAERDVRPKPLQRGKRVTSARDDEEKSRQQDGDPSAARRCQRRCAHVHPLEQTIQEHACDWTRGAAANGAAVQ